MLLIIDANSLFSFFKKESGVRELVVNSGIKYGLTLIAPKRLFVELDKHKQEICEKAGISEEEYEFPRKVLELFIETKSDTFWQDSKSEANKILEQHIKDIPYVALALELKKKGEDVSILSNEKKFKKLEEHGIRVFTTRKLLEYLKSLGFKF